MHPEGPPKVVLRLLRISLIFLVLLLISASLPALGAAPPTAIGFIKSASGDAVLLRDGHRIAAAPGGELLRGDRLVTGRDGAMAVVLRDDTVMSLGPSTETSLQHFALDGGHPGMLVKVVRGVVAYVSGKLAKVSPDAVRLQTPTATLGVRGTFLLIEVAP